MIIADTSVWIEFFRNHQPYFSLLCKYMESRSIVALTMIFGELLQGTKSTHEKSILLNYYEYLPKISESNLMIKAGVYSHTNQLIQKGVGLIDACIITGAVENQFKIWTLDEKLKRAVKPELLYAL
jgi:hypothetical protein